MYARNIMISDDEYNMKRLDQSKTKIQKAMVEKEPAITLSHATPLSSVTNHHKSFTAKIPKIRQNISL